MRWRSLIQHGHVSNVHKPEHLPADGGAVTLHCLCKLCEDLHQEITRTALVVDNDGKGRMTATANHYSLAQLRDSCIAGCHMCCIIWLSVQTVADWRSSPQKRVVLCFDLMEWLGQRASIKVAVTDDIDERGEDLVGRSLVVRLKTDQLTSKYHRFLEPGIAIPCTSLSPDLLHLITSWYDECQHHPECQDLQRQLPRCRPRRLLEVHTDKIRLCTDTAAISDLQYVTLSHRWDNNVTKLCHESLSQFQSEISPALLSPAFLNAITITRALGIGYIWIDSLCIIQDSEEDWNAEARMMASIYEGSACTILNAATGADRTEAARRDPRYYTPCWLKGRSENATDRLIFPPFKSTINTEHAVEARWNIPILSRSWVFQEYLLSPRIIHYGQQALQWECLELCKAEYPEHITLLSDTELPILQPSNVIDIKQEFYGRLIYEDGLGTRTMELPIFCEIWLDIVQRYLRTQLTYESDRVVALAGVAESLSRRTGFTYLAGCWQESLVPFLLWRRGAALSVESSIRSIEHGRPKMSVPSWSWFSFAISANKSGLDFGITGTALSFVHKHPSNILFIPQIISCESECSSRGAGDPLIHQFRGLVLSLKAPIYPISVQRVGAAISINCRDIPDNEWVAQDPLPGSYGFFDSLGLKFRYFSGPASSFWHCPSNFYHHDTLLEDEQILHVYLLPLIRIHWENSTSDYALRAECLTVGLALQRVSEMSWRRIGLFGMNRSMGTEQIQHVAEATKPKSYYDGLPFDFNTDRLQEIRIE